MEEKKKFTYTYSSTENNEIKKIREKYEYKNESVIDQLHRLDRSVYNTATAISLIFGIIGLLILGLGLSCVLVWKDSMFDLGIVIGVIGIIFLACAYPAYQISAKTKKKKIAPKILKLTDEIIKK